MYVCRPGSVQLVNESQELLMEDYESIRALEDHGMFTVAPATVAK